MNRNSYRHRFTAWIACLAIVMSSLAPSVSHALAWVKADRLQTVSLHGHDRAHGEVSTAGHAAQAHALSDDEVPAQSSPNLHFEHCAYCLVHAGSFALPPTPAAAPNEVFVESVALARFEVYIQQASAWSLARPRAPPSLRPMALS